ncbi:hypothetical protein [Blastococcus brunescens]|uniref:Uncharacterized protein n=1 Tax=Blastococcus brunescens TaxID=1564165 RepID=A0ABZ1B3M1_9ACTN|nr:hypothetical protein [Blastococcus sp. BMG 8361]WRL65409.1 hypothetical protein U6N30_07190 [Blastococcus sp. BMG 8361]
MTGTATSVGARRMGGLLQTVEARDAIQPDCTRPGPVTGHLRGAGSVLRFTASDTARWSPAIRHFGCSQPSTPTSSTLVDTA